MTVDPERRTPADIPDLTLAEQVEFVRRYQAEQIRSEHDKPGSTRTEWLVTGDAGCGFPYYHHVFTDDEDGMRDLVNGKGFSANVHDVRVSKRTVTITDWEQVDTR